MPMTGGWDRLTPEGEKFFRQIDELQEKEVFVGFQAGKVTDDRGVDMAQIAMWNELGTSTAPSRPFLRKSVDENADPINAMCAQQLKVITAGGTAEQSLKQIGVFGTSSFIFLFQLSTNSMAIFKPSNTDISLVK